MPIESYHTIKLATVAEFKEKGSKFLAYAFPILDVGDFKQHLAETKKQHPKATHHCFAYRIGIDKLQFRSHDDGEPSGTAGKPILGQIDSYALTNVLVIVVRYFGGTQLGVPGLIQAYKTATNEAIMQAEIIEKPVLIQYKLQFNYEQLNDAMQAIKQFDCMVEERVMDKGCSIIIAVSKAVELALVKHFEHNYLIRIDKL